MRRQEQADWGGLEELRDYLRRCLLRYSRDENEIDDVIQETFIRAARYRANLTDPKRLRYWAMRIARNVLSDLRRRRARCQGAPAAQGALEAVQADEEGPVELVAERELRLGGWIVERRAALAELSRALSSLREEDRRLLDSFYRGDESCRKTADECDIPAHLVKIRLFRARRRLLRAMRRRFSLALPLAHAGRNGS